ncbi:MAG: histidinol-phosphate transaminase [Aminipila sp.]
MSKFLNKNFQRLVPYKPGEQPRDRRYIKLNTNESPFPPSDKVLQAIGAEEISNLRLYSDSQCSLLSEKLANLYGISTDQIFFSNGSDDILNFAFMAFSGEGICACFPDITYGFYKVFANLNNTEYVEIPLQDNFSINHRDYCNINKFIVIANPNAPTGLSLTIPEIEEIVRSNPNNVVVIDEAYVDFGSTSCYPLITSYKNLLVVQTFSKSRSMAGARLGFAIGSPELINDLNTIKFSTNPYNVNSLTLALGQATLDSNEYYLKNCRLIADIRDNTTKVIESLGFNVIPSKANFIFTNHPNFSGKFLYEKLKEKGILVRHFDLPRISSYIRITIGTQSEMDFLLEQLKNILNYD